MDASNVMMKASTSNRKPLDEFMNIGGIQQISVPNGETVNVTVNANSATTLRSIVISVADTDRGNGMYSWIRTTVLSSHFFAIREASGLTFTSTGENTFSVTNSSGAYALLFFFLGSAMTLTTT